MTICKDYCLNSSLAGLCYIADHRYHFTERIFWLFCVILSWIGSIYLIMNFMDSYYHNSISMGVQSLLPTETSNFPSVAICEMGYSQETYEVLEEKIESMRKTESMEYNFDVEDFMMRVVFHNLYNLGSMSTYCAPYIDNEDSIQCPTSGYQELADKVRSNCSKLFLECLWNEVSFDCCHYFIPLKTTMGKCFLLNSIQTVTKGGKNWLNMKVGFKEGNGHLQLRLSKASSLYIINEEDIPHMLLTSLQFPQFHEGFDEELLLSVQNTANDPNVRNIDQTVRKCIFPDEPTPSLFRRYSYSVCVTECLKMAQIAACNCTHYNMVFDENDKSPSCDYNGLYCLERRDIMFPQTTILQPWRTNGLVCQCLPSCNESEINVVGRSSKINDGETDRRISIKLQSLPTQRYFRQAVREELDIVVSVGGILGLFMGASILSLVEIIYFFTIRVCGNRRNEKLLS
ncbi:unnamed protein product [Diamesa serratosioi]